MTTADATQGMQRGVTGAAGDAADIMEGLEWAREPEFEIRGTKFHMTKMPAKEGMVVFHLLRESFASIEAQALAPAEGDDAGWGELIRSIATKMPTSTFDQIQARVFAHVRFTNSYGAAQSMIGNEDEACRDAFDILEVWIRAVAFNFLESFLEKLSGLGTLSPR